MIHNLDMYALLMRSMTGVGLRSMPAPSSRDDQ